MTATLSSVGSLASPVHLEMDATVAEARTLMSRTGQAIFLLTHVGRPVAVLTAADLDLSGNDEDTVGSRVRWELVDMSPSADTNQTIRRYRKAARASLLRRQPFREEHLACTS